MDSGRIHRLLRIITMLRARQGYNAEQLARELEVSVRTVYRDLNALELAGVPYQYDPDTRGYTIGGDYFLPPIQLTLDEALSLSVLASQLARQRQIPFLEEAWRAMTKIESQLPGSIRQELSSTDQSLFVQEARISPQNGCQDYFRTVRSAIAARRKVRCTYDSGLRGDSGEPFLFRPYALFFNQRAWYVIGYSELRHDERCLKLNRITQLEGTDLPYMIPDGWSLESHVGKAWRMIRGDHRYHIVIRFSREFARTVADTLWHPTQRIAEQADGSCLFECEVDGLSEIVWWVMGYGPHAEVIEPQELRDQVHQLAKGMCAVYQSNRQMRNTSGKQGRSLSSRTHAPFEP